LTPEATNAFFWPLSRQYEAKPSNALFGTSKLIAGENSSFFFQGNAHRKMLNEKNVQTGVLTCMVGWLFVCSFL